jgi:hypothetical protein
MLSKDTIVLAALDAGFTIKPEEREQWDYLAELINRIFNGETK